MANPFLEEEEISGPRGPSNHGYGEIEDGRRNILEQINASEDRQLESTRRALSSIYDSERMGVATAEELARQGEQLNNIESKVTDIDKNMTTTQKHLNSIKSVFGGIKNWWSSKKEDSAPRPEQTETSSRLKAAMENQGAPLGAEAGRRRPDTSGFGEEDDLDSRFMAGSRKPVQNQGYGQASGQQQILQPVTGSSREEETNDNLAMMSDGMSRLRDLALGLGDEISRQNAQLDRISPKVDNVNVKVEDQNRQMRRILHNK